MKLERKVQSRASSGIHSSSQAVTSFLDNAITRLSHIAKTHTKLAEGGNTYLMDLTYPTSFNMAVLECMDMSRQSRGTAVTNFVRR